MPDLTLQVRTRVQLPEQKNPTVQSLYVFSMCRAAAFVTSFLCEVVAERSQHVAVDVLRELDRLGVALAGDGRASRHPSSLDPDADFFGRLGRFGGYLYHGFPALAPQHARDFCFIGAAILVACDPRDIALALAGGHPDGGGEDGPLSIAHVERAKRATEPYLLLRSRGVPVIRYEDYVAGGAFRMREFADALAFHLAPGLRLAGSRSELSSIVAERAATLKEMEPRMLGGLAGSHRSLDRDRSRALASALSTELRSFGYL